MKNGMFCGKISSDDAKWISEKGFDFAVGSGDEDFITLCHRYHLKPWACLGTFHPPSKDEKYLCVSITGERKEWFYSGCPNNPDVIDYAIERYGKQAEKDVYGIFCDGIRFASPASGLEAFFTCFCNHCEKRAIELGLDFQRMKNHVSTLYQHCKNGLPFVDRCISKSPSLTLLYFLSLPGVCDWLWFRKKIISDFIEKLSHIVRSKNKKFGGYFFSPCLSTLVGQDYSMVGNFIDVCSPMLYRNTPDKGSIAPLNTELEVMTEWAKKEKSPDWAVQFTALSSEIKKKSDFLKKGICIEDIAEETFFARKLVDKKVKLIPILWWKDKSIRKTIKKVMDAGACGIQIFWYTEETKKFIHTSLTEFL